MSGHANFNTISGYTALHLPPSPQVEDDIHVAGNRPVGGANDGGIGVGPQNAQVDAQAESTKAAREMSASFQYISDGYFTRDFVRAIAKPGWFDEEITLPKAPEGQ